MFITKLINLLRRTKIMKQIKHKDDTTMKRWGEWETERRDISTIRIVKLPTKT